MSIPDTKPRDKYTAWNRAFKATAVKLGVGKLVSSLHEEPLDSYISVHSLHEQESAGTAAEGGLKRIFSDWKLVAIILLASTLAFGIGTAAGKESTAVRNPNDGLWIEQLPKEELAGSVSTSTQAKMTDPSIISSQTTQAAAVAAAAPSKSPNGNYVASKTGTKYYAASCGTAKRIKNENKVWFETKQAAEAAGFKPGSTCKSL